jgi:hypothetical protein
LRLRQNCDTRTQARVAVSSRLIRSRRSDDFHATPHSTSSDVHLKWAASSSSTRMAEARAYACATARSARLAEIHDLELACTAGVGSINMVLCVYGYLDDRFHDSAAFSSSALPRNTAISKAGYDSNFGNARLGSAA